MASSVLTPDPVVLQHKRPDIALFIVDDLLRTTLPVYGASSKFGALTPNINRIVRRGTVFENAYASAPICTPSRLGLLTGRYVNDLLPPALFETIPRVHFDGPDLTNMTTLPRMLNGAGYRTGLFGKYHLAPRRYLAEPMARACDAQVPSEADLDDPVFLRDWKPFRKPGCVQALIKQQVGFRVAKEVYFDTLAIEELGHNPEAMAEAAISFVRAARKDEKPFFMYFAPTLTHSPLCYGGALLEEPGAVDEAPNANQLSRWKQQRRKVLLRLMQAGLLCPDEETARRVDALRAASSSAVTNLHAGSLTSPITASATSELRHRNDSWLRAKMPNGTAAISARENCPRGRTGTLHMTCPTHNSSEAYVQTLVDSSAPSDFTVDGIGAVSYMEMVAGLSWLDESLAPLLDALEPAEDTLVIFTSDHGNGLTGKGAVYEGGVRVPMIARWPRGSWGVEERSDVLISHLDLMPTLATLVGVTPPAGARGRDMLAKIYPYCAFAEGSNGFNGFSRYEKRTHYQKHREVYFEIGYSRGVVRNGWKLIRQIGPRNSTNAGDWTTDPNLLLKREGGHQDCLSVQGQVLDPVNDLFDPAGKHMLWRSFELHQKTYCDAVQLYWLPGDPLEQKNVAHKHGKLVKELSQMLRTEFGIVNVKWKP